MGGKHCVGRQPDKRGAEKGAIPYKPRFPEQMFGLARVPWKSKKPALGGPLCRSQVVRWPYASATMRSCQYSYSASDILAKIVEGPLLFSATILSDCPEV